MRTPRAAAVARFAVVLIALATLTSACGSGPTPQVWATSVCQALAPWRATIGDLARSTQQQMTAQTTPAQAKENLVRLLAGAEQASETARRAVQEAGVPDVEQGGAVARGFVNSLTGVRDAYAKARKTIEGLSAGQPEAFYAEVKATIELLNQEYAASALDTSNLDSPELTQAFDEVPACR